MQKEDFINRIDEIIIFNQLSKNDMYNILDKIIKDVEFRLKDKGITIELTNDAKEYIIENSYESKYGARPLKRYISRNIETMIANNIILDKIKYGEHLIIDIEKEEFIII